MSEVSKSKFIGSAMWKILESFSSKGISMVVSLILARLLTPDQFGVISLTTVFVNFSDILLQGGFSTALIQKKEISDSDYSTVMCISVGTATILYLAIFFAAPMVAVYFEEPLLKNVLRVIALVIFCQAFGAVRTAVITRKLEFRTLFVCTCISNVLSGLIGVVMAFMGFGVWALVFQQLSQQTILTVLLYIRVKIKVRLQFSKESFRAIVPFSVKVLLSSLMSFIADSAYSVMIGKKYSLDDLGYYNKGGQFPRQFSLYTFGAISSVLLTAMSRYADDKERLKQMVRKVHITSNYIIFPLMTGLCCVAEPFVSVVLTDKWLPCVGVLQWTCLYYAFTPIMLTNVQLHLALGNGEMRIRQETIRMILMFGTLALFAFMDSNVTILACVQAFITVFIALVSCFETQRSIAYSLWEQLKDNFSTILCTAGMAIAVVLLGRLAENMFIKLVVQIVVGVAAYVVLSAVTKNAGFHNVLGIVLSRRKKA